MFEPSYLSLYRSGELQKRVEALEARLHKCDICPRACAVDRFEGETGFCRSGALPIIASVCAHHGEEPPLSGSKGSGTVFLGNCNMRCVYCQNYQISQNWPNPGGQEMTCKELAQQLLYLQNNLGCHNINFVSPSHFVPQIARAVLEAVPLGLKIPLVYNTGGYDSLDTLKMLDGFVDIYLPDIRYADDRVATEYSDAQEYVKHSRAAIKEMFRQVGNLTVDRTGVAQHGIIIRHLILPGDLAGSRESLIWLAHEISPDVYLSIMAQYYPAFHAGHYPVLARRITKTEYDSVLQVLDSLGMENGWIQSLDSPDNYRPDFKRKSHPFLSD